MTLWDDEQPQALHAVLRYIYSFGYAEPQRRGDFVRAVLRYIYSFGYVESQESNVGEVTLSAPCCAISTASNTSGPSGTRLTGSSIETVQSSTLLPRESAFNRCG